MITYPSGWRKNYEEFSNTKPFKKVNIKRIIDSLIDVLSYIDVKHLAYSGGIDSTIILCLISKIFTDVSTYTISIREDHPDIKFSYEGSSFYKSNHHIFITSPSSEKNISPGDDAVKKLFENVSVYTDKIICCDGIDEFMCGYYKHTEKNNLEIYNWFLSRLLPDHLEPLNMNSKNTKVYLPYLDELIISIFSRIPLDKKMDSLNRKKIVVEIAKYLGIPRKIIYRNKYGFCDAFLKKDK